MNNEEDPATTTADDNIYRAPTVDTTPSPGDNLYAACIGPKNTEYYLAHFDTFENGGSRVSWHWPAFLISSIWLLYRKMWLNALLYWVALPIVLTVLSGVVESLAGVETSLIFYYTTYVLITFVLVPMYANWLYFRHVQAKVDKLTASPPTGETPALAIARIGGTSKVILAVLPFFFIVVLGILAAIAIPAYQDYAIRAQVSEGLALSGNAKAAVADEFLSSGVLPPDNASVGLPDATSINGRFVTGVEVVEGEVVITYGNEANPVIHGRSIVLSPRISNGDLDPGSAVSWSCDSPSIVPKHLPAACR